MAFFIAQGGLTGHIPHTGMCFSGTVLSHLCDKKALYCAIFIFYLPRNNFGTLVAYILSGTKQQGGGFMKYVERFGMVPQSWWGNTVTEMLNDLAQPLRRNDYYCEGM